MNPDKTVIYQFVHNRRRQKVGVVLAKKIGEGKVGIGWSLCNPSDTFKKEHALAIAAGRAESLGGNTELPRSIYNDFDVIVNRANRYFKDCAVLY